MATGTDLLQKPELPELHACPLCGASQGYYLKVGETFRWFDVICAGCHTIVAEARRGDHLADGRNPAADAVWNEAGAYAAKLAVECERLEKAAEHLMAELDLLRLCVTLRQPCVELLREVYNDGLKTNMREWQERTNAALIAADSHPVVSEVQAAAVQAVARAISDAEAERYGVPPDDEWQFSGKRHTATAQDALTAFRAVVACGVEPADTPKGGG